MLRRDVAKYQYHRSNDGESYAQILVLLKLRDIKMMQQSIREDWGKVSCEVDISIMFSSLFLARVCTNSSVHDILLFVQFLPFMNQMKWRQYDRYSKNMYFSHKIYRYKRSLDSQVMLKVTTNFEMLRIDRKLDLLQNIIEGQLVEYTSWWSDPHNTQRIYLHSSCIQAIIYLIGLAWQNIILHLIQNHWLCYHNNFIISKHSFAAHIWCYLVRIIFYIYSTLGDMTCLQHRNIYCLTIFIAHNFTYILHHAYHYFHIQ